MVAGVPTFGQVEWCLSSDNYRFGVVRHNATVLDRNTASLFAPGGCKQLQQVYAGSDVTCGSVEGLPLLDPSPDYNWVKRITPHPDPLARLSCLNDSIVLDIRGKEGRVEHRVIQGRDMLKWTLRSYACTLLHVSVVHSFGYEHLKGPGLRVFVQTSAELSEAVGREIFAAVEARLGVRPTFVSIRNDNFFIETGFPLPYAFSTVQVPSQEEYSRTRTLACVNRRGEIGCGVITQ